MTHWVGEWEMNMRLELRDYPELIAEKELALLRLDRQITRDKNALESAINEIEREIAFDEELRNDHQRRAKKHEMLTSQAWYEELTARIAETEGEIRRMSIELNLLRNQFSLEKLLLRERVAMA